MSLVERLESGFGCFGMFTTAMSVLTSATLDGVGYKEVSNYFLMVGTGVGFVSLLASLICYTIGGPYVPYEQDVFHK